MNNIRALALCFVFVSLAAGQSSLNGVGLNILPPEIEKLLGNTFSGEILRGGMDGFPIHGGSGTDPSGLRNGWGADPNEPRNQAESNMNGVGVMPGGGPFAQSSIQDEHNIAKEVNHAGRQNIGGINPVARPVVNPVGHHVEQTNLGQQRHNIAKIQNHNIVKSSGIISAGKPSYLRRRPMHARVVGHSNPAIISHNIGKASLGADSMISHNIAKSSGPGVGFINQNGHVAEKTRVNQMGHNIAKSTGRAMLGRPIGGGYIGLSQLRGLSNGLVGRNHHGVVAHGVVGHNIAKSTGSRVSTGFINGGVHVTQKIGVNPIAHHSAKNQHNTVKSSMGKVNGGGYVAHRLGVNRVAHHFAKNQHNIVKSSMGGSNGGGHNAHRVGVNPAAHHSAKVQHNIVKSSMGGSNGGGHVAHRVGVNPAAHNSAKVQHNSVKSSIGGSNGGGHVANMIGINPFAHQAARVQHNIIKSSMGGVRPTGGAVNRQFGMFLEDPVHRVNKVSRSGIAAVGHDRLAANIGHGIARQVVGQSADAVNIGSNGGVSAGNPVAIAATHGLAKESLHVAGKTLNIAASQSNPIRSNGRFGVGNNVFGGIHPIPVHPKPLHPKPVVKPPQKFPTGYGRRRNV